MENEELKSPLEVNDVIKFDYNKLRNETTNIALMKVMALIANTPGLVTLEGQTSAQTEEQYKNIDKCSFQVLQVMNENNVRMEDFGYLFAQIKAIVTGVERCAILQVDEHSANLASKIMGVKNPGTGEFDNNFATYKDLLDTVERFKQ